MVAPQPVWGDIWTKRNPTPLCWETALAGSTRHPSPRDAPEDTLRWKCPAYGPGRTTLVTWNRRGLLSHLTVEGDGARGARGHCW